MDIERMHTALKNRADLHINRSEFPQDIIDKGIKVINTGIASSLPFDSALGTQAIRNDLQLLVDAGRTRPDACNTILMEVMFDDLMTSAEDQFDKDNYASFIALYDFSFGFAETLARISTAESSHANETWISETLDTLYEDEIPSLGDQAEAYIEIVKEIQHCKDLLAQDPTGISLLEDFIQRLEDPNSRSGKMYTGMSEIPEFIVAGAKAALEYYRKLYLLSE